MGWRGEEDEEEISSRMQLLELADGRQHKTVSHSSSVHRGSELEASNVQGGMD